ncbi:type VI secretion system lipoprotein TssJ [Paludibacterium purpuratum]|uniref:Type VI secretion system protein VasD n=1 Tax=Paludibacterium purpuratum TaxID=1144873 RepID=A0A4R7AU07_9NEIS|nr:type VI secretion system lipoprotein TssJ [Paludibacterium purpuratum]TDR70275.1 type VI secretion system protein VasD [Paludibacterium purpuratum]
MNSIRDNWLRLCASAAICLLLSACASGPSNANYLAIGTRNLNPDESGHPLSLVIHIVQLKQNQAFSRLTPADLTSGKSEKDLLSSEMIDSTELVLLPGSKSDINATISPDAKYIGVIGYFRQPDPYFWRLLFDADMVRVAGVNLLADRCFLRPTLPPRLDMPGQPKIFKPDCSMSSR